MNQHESIWNMLPLAAAGALEFEELRQIEQHVQVCDKCRRELETWSQYAEELHQLPQPSVPAGLLERTHTRILQQNTGATEDRVDAILLGAIAIFGWAVGLTLWVVARGLTGGAVNLLGMNLVDPLSWSLLSAVLTWITATASAAAVVRYRDMRTDL
jgi:hypothetical protein